MRVIYYKRVKYNLFSSTEREIVVGCLKFFAITAIEISSTEYSFVTPDALWKWRAIIWCQMKEKQYLRHSAVGCIFKGNKIVEFSDAIEQYWTRYPGIFFRYYNGRVCVFCITIVAHYAERVVSELFTVFKAQMMIQVCTCAYLPLHRLSQLAL